MWFQGLGGFSFSAFLGNGDRGFFTFRTGDSALQQAQTRGGDPFQSSGRPFEAFGEVFIPGSSSNGIGVELYTFNSEGRLEVFADIFEGTSSSFLSSPSVARTADGTPFIVGTARLTDTTYIGVYVTEGGLARPLAEVSSTLGPYYTLGAPMSYLGEDYQLVYENDAFAGVGTLDPVSGAFEPLGTMPDGLTPGQLRYVSVENGQLFATVQYSFNDHALFRLGETGVWTAIDATFNGGFATAPRPQFTVDGTTYFLANANSYGIELLKLNENGLLELVTNSSSPTSNSFYALTDFEVNGITFFFANNGDLSGAILAINDAGEPVIAGYADGRTGSGFGYIVDVEAEEVITFFDGVRSGEPNYILSNGTLAEFTLPEGTVKELEFHNGTIYASIEPSEGGFGVWAKPLSGDWRQLFSVEDAPSTQRIIYFGHASGDDFGADIYFGDDSDEVITALDGHAVIHAAGGHDHVQGRAGDDTVFGEGGDDTLTGGPGDDTVSGGDGNDVLRGNAGDDELDGGPGIDTVSYADATGRVAVFLNGDAREVGAGEGRDTFVSIENVLGSRFNDRLVGDGGDNVLDGGRGDDVLIGQNGNDTLLGGAGNDILNGSGGHDLLDGGEGHDTLIGLGGADVFYGRAGNDMINGNLGRDTAYGGDGNDQIYGNLGSDTLFGENGDDEIFGKAAQDMIDGGAGNDRLVGGNGRDAILGGTGNDLLVGATGQDVLFGGAGNDRLFGGGTHGLGDEQRDVFVFKSAANGGGGFDIIRDFENGRDKLDLSESGYTRFADVLADAAETNGNLTIDFDFSGLLRIESFTLAQFDAGDVIL